MFRRIQKLNDSNSLFLFGARGTGKTSLLRDFIQGKKTLWIDLLLPREYRLLSSTPENLTARIQAANLNAGDWVVIDEVQRVPELLDLAHYHIEKDKLRFALTGSSARKLKRSGANLLAGRAYTYQLHPLVSQEIASGTDFDLIQALEIGTLPMSWANPENAALYLESYTETYLKEEIALEQWVRNLPSFQRFLAVAAQMNGKQLNYTAIAKEVGSDPKTVQTYFEILEDTLVAFKLESYHRSIRKRQLQSPRYYLFDLGVKRSLDGTIDSRLIPQTGAYGEAFEHFVILEILRLNQYSKSGYRASYLTTKDGAEIDLILEAPSKKTVLIEIKSKTEVTERDARHLFSFEPEFQNSKALLISNDPDSKQWGNIHAHHWRTALKELFEFEKQR